MKKEPLSTVREIPAKQHHRYAGLQSPGGEYFARLIRISGLSLAILLIFCTRASARTGTGSNNDAESRLYVNDPPDRPGKPTRALLPVQNKIFSVAPAPPINVRGRLTNESGDPIAGITVSVRGTEKSTLTDNNGEFFLNGIDSESTLLFTGVNIEPLEIKVNNNPIVNATVTPRISDLEEAVVIGYGTQKKDDITGSISKFNTSQVSNIPNHSILQALQGQIPGLSIGTSNRAGVGPDILIRGINSLSASNSPLIVVDGIIYNGSLNDFNVNDFETVNVLKDASAAAVYGSRSANGVILITTKKGSTEKPVISINLSAGPSNPVSLIRMKDGPGYIRKILDYREITGRESDPDKIEEYLNATEAENYRNGKTINWYDVILKPATLQQYNASVSGRSSRTNYYVSGSLFNQEGIVVNDDFKRATFKAYLKNNITDWYSISLNTSYSNVNYAGLPASFNIALSPYGSYWEDEANGIYKEFPMEDPLYAHPLMTTLIDNVQERNNMLLTASSELNVPFIKGLKWTLNYSINQLNDKNSTFYNNQTNSGSGRTLNGRAIKNLSETFNRTIDNIVSYSRMFGRKHSVNATFLYSREFLKIESTSAEGSDFFSQETGFNNLGLAQVQQIGSGFEDQNSVAVMGRINYAYNSKYALTATVRRDGFSGFSENHKYASFPSLALAWTVSNERFLQQTSWINLLKLRISYGENGNQALGRYKTFARIGNSQYVFGDGGNTVTTSYLTSMANDNLKWETTKSKNIGIDFRLFNNVLSGSVDLYSADTYDMLLTRKIPWLTGYTEVWSNIGNVHNRGMEIGLQSAHLKRGKLSWESGFTFFINRNKIVSLYGEDADGDGKEDDDLSNNWFIGESLGSVYGFEVDGVYQTGDPNILPGFSPGDFRLADLNKDNKIDQFDRRILGTTLPNYTFSLSNTLRLGNFSLYVMINAIRGGGKKNYYIGDNIGMHSVNSLTSTTYSERFNIVDVPYWTPDNPTNEFAKVNYIASRQHPYLESRSFVRIQDVTLSYSFGQALLSRIGIRKLMVFASGKNLATFTKWTGYDPENQTTFGDYPMIRIVDFGINLEL